MQQIYRELISTPPELVIHTYTLSAVTDLLGKYQCYSLFSPVPQQDHKSLSWVNHDSIYQAFLLPTKQFYRNSIVQALQVALAEGG